MSERELPPPSTTAETYLAAILDELRALNRRPQLREDEDDAIELREPAKAPQRRRRN